MKIDSIEPKRYEYEDLIKRLRERKLQEQKPARMRARAAPAARASARSPRPQISTAPRGESHQLIIAAVGFLGFGVWLASSAQAYFAAEDPLAAACERNSFFHAASVYCFDGRRMVHTVNPDGTTTKSGFDWRVNEAARRKAEAAEEREARRARSDES